MYHFYKERGVWRAVSKVCDGALRENRWWFLAVKSFTVLPHYPRKIKYLQNIFKISLKNTSFFVIEPKRLLLVSVVSAFSATFVLEDSTLFLFLDLTFFTASLLITNAYTSTCFLFFVHVYGGVQPSLLIADWIWSPCAYLPCSSACFKASMYMKYFFLSYNYTQAFWQFTFFW